MVFEMMVHGRLATSDYLRNGLAVHTTCEVSLLHFSPLWVSAEDAIAIGTHMELPHVISEMAVRGAFSPSHVLIEHLRDDGTLE